MDLGAIGLLLMIAGLSLRLIVRLVSWFAK
jgi:hypothetical protein